MSDNGDFMKVVPAADPKRKSPWSAIWKAIENLSENEALQLDCAKMNVQPTSVASALGGFRRSHRIRQRLSFRVEGNSIFVTNRGESKPPVDFKEPA